ncbi:hypothetical protein ILYODFUR_036227 [Ilyodon furcidens]|uniref:Uncharacterized protein n=1 Tax=Ilyodon furcidens TaxID=33524 RepID=A0ABV0UM86_9TELE
MHKSFCPRITYILELPFQLELSDRFGRAAPDLFTSQESVQCQLWFLWPDTSYVEILPPKLWISADPPQLQGASWLLP